ncbi:MAG: 16S rRNA (cytosine(967)-C(5))-methyltransferase RsmB, partial [Verrucomicrobia bacterium]|nr:16S rRNA (cytosine(967)-C(5))-methyltransferase RsmB [Verrucomicrobiota bacterium]
MRQGKKSEAKIRSRATARSVAYGALARRLTEGRPVEELLETDLRFRQLPLRERRLTQELVYGVVRWQSLLDWLVSRRMGGRRVKRLLLQLLRLGVYQILWLDRVPDHAAVNETVELAKEVGFSDQAGLVNAILRAYAREKDQAWEAIRRLQEENPARGWSHPRWLADRWTARWGR